MERETPRSSVDRRAVRLVHSGPREYGWRAVDAATGEALVMAVSETMLRFECRLRGWRIEADPAD